MWKRLALIFIGIAGSGFSYPVLARAFDRPPPRTSRWRSPVSASPAASISSRAWPTAADAIR